MIVFVDYQYKGVGGVGQIVVNTTLELNRRGLKSKLYCSKTSYEYTSLVAHKADFVHIDSDLISLSQVKKYLEPEDVIILTNISCSPLLERIKHINNKLLFYCVHPDTFNYDIHIDWLRDQKKARKELICLLQENNALYFMDGPNVKSICGADSLESCRSKFLPVPVMNFSGQSRPYNSLGAIQITYLGRGNSEWKVYPVIKILKDLNQVGLNTFFTIITDVNDMFEQMIAKYIPTNNVNVEYKNNLYGEELENYLLSSSSLHIAMGISALDGAKLGIPTILIDYSKQEFPDNYLYRWLFECEDYCLAGEIIDGKMPYPVGQSLRAIIDQISTSGGYNEIANKCLAYANSIHSVSSFVDNLVKAINNSTMTTQLYCASNFSKNIQYVTPLIKIGARVKHLFRSVFVI